MGTSPLSPSSLGSSRTPLYHMIPSDTTPKVSCDGTWCPNIKGWISWSEMTLNYWLMVDIYPNLKENIGSSIPAFEISSLLDRKLAWWSTASCTLALACRPFISKKNEKMKKKMDFKIDYSCRCDKSCTSASNTAISWASNVAQSAFSCSSICFAKITELSLSSAFSHIQVNKNTDVWFSFLFFSFHYSPKSQKPQDLVW